MKPEGRQPCLQVQMEEETQATALQSNSIAAQLLSALAIPGP